MKILKILLVSMLIFIPSTLLALNYGTMNVKGTATFQKTPVLPNSGAGLIPVGSFIWTSTTTAPTGYLYCNGASVSTTTYSALYAVIGFRFGNPGSGNMKLPDGRGLFIRQLDDGKGRDPDGSFRTSGSTQTFATQEHFHSQSVYDTDVSLTAGTGSYAMHTANINAGGNISNSIGSLTTDPAYGTVRISTETRPSNMALCLMIKY